MATGGGSRAIMAPVLAQGLKAKGVCVGPQLMNGWWRGRVYRITGRLVWAVAFVAVIQAILLGARAEKHAK